jgi:hypothetical protein
MRIPTICSLLLSTLVLAHTAHATPVHLWSHNYGDLDDQFMGTSFMDPSGNLILCGSFYGSVNIATPYTSLGARDAIVAKWDTNGNPLWSRRVGFKSVDTGWSGTTDIVGNVILVGSTGPHPNERDAFIARYSPTGTLSWIKYFVASDSIAYATVVATDSNKHIHVAGQFNGSINLGGSTLVAAAENDVFMAEFDAGGNHVWSKAFSASGGVGELGGIGVDQFGQPVLYGDFSGSVNFGGGALVTVGGSNLFLAKFDTDGVPLWSKRFGEALYQRANGMAVDPNGRICITGTLDGNINFGGGLLTPVGAPDIFLAMFTPAGAHLWSKRFGGADSEEGFSVAFASNSDVLLSASGYGPSPVDFGGGPLSAQPNFNDLFVARFFAFSGSHRWSTIFSGSGNTYGSADEYNGQMTLGGAFDGTVNLGGSDLVSNGAGDFFVARFSDAVTGAGPVPAGASLQQNVPNPFNPTTEISYSLATPARAVVEIFDASGAVVARLDGGLQPAGIHTATWNGLDAVGRRVASGVYFYRLAGMPDVAAKKMVLLK